eukprot:m51a1_g13022 hypothetical protein (120) ;mRNA; r:97-456
MTSFSATTTSRPLTCGSVTRTPERASASVTLTVHVRSLPSRWKNAWGFWRSTKTMSAGCWPGSSSPSRSKVTRVPSFQPGLTSIERTLLCCDCEPLASTTVRVTLSFLVHPLYSSSSVQ